MLMATRTVLCVGGGMTCRRWTAARLATIVGEALAMIGYVSVLMSGCSRCKMTSNWVSVQWKTLIFDTENGALNNANANRILYK